MKKNILNFQLDITVNDNVFVGIDPDTSKSGVALWHTKKKQFVYLDKLYFFQLFDLLKTHKYSIDLVRIEGGWLNKKSNFHGRAYQSKAAGERIAKNVGSNHETGRKIVEMCAYLGIRHEVVTPLGKLNPNYFQNMTNLDIRDQDIIDAAMLVHGLTLNHLKLLEAV